MKKKVIILGAGITGLVTAYYFSQDKDFEVTLIEKNKYVGGTAMAFEYKDFILDYELFPILHDYKINLFPEIEK